MGDFLTVKDRRWICLNQLTELLSKGEVQIEDLVKEDHRPSSPDFTNKSDQFPRTGPIIPKPTHNPARLKNLPPTHLEANPSPPCKRKTSSESGAGCSKKEKKRFELDRHIMADNHPPSPSDPALPRTFLNHIMTKRAQPGSLVFLIEKLIFPTDVSASHARLSVPCCQVKNRFLTAGEAAELESEGRIAVALVQPEMEESRLTFKCWRSNSTYVLFGGWNEVRQKLTLTVGKTVRLWAFRRDSELCFVLVEV